MQLSKIKDLLNCRVLSCSNKLEQEISGICASDLMSSALTCKGPNSLLITGLNNLQVIRTAEMSDIAAVVFVLGIQPGKEIIELAQENGIVVLVTEYSMFESCGILYKAGFRCGYKDFS